MLRNKRKRKQRIRQQFLVPPSSMPPGLGFKSSRILGLEEAFIPELRRIEPIPNMSEANLARLHRRRQAMEEERNARMKAAMEEGQFQHHQRDYNRQMTNQPNQKLMNKDCDYCVTSCTFMFSFNTNFVKDIPMLQWSQKECFLVLYHANP